MMADIPENVEYPIDPIRVFLARNPHAVVFFEFSAESLLYLNYAYRKFFL